MNGVRASIRIARRSLIKAQRKMKAYVDKTGRTPREFAVGDLVKLYRAKKGRKHQFLLRATGPYQVIERLAHAPAVYRIRANHGQIRTFNVERLAPWNLRKPMYPTDACLVPPQRPRKRKNLQPLYFPQEEGTPVTQVSNYAARQTAAWIRTNDLNMAREPIQGPPSGPTSVERTLAGTLCHQTHDERWGIPPPRKYGPWRLPFPRQGDPHFLEHTYRPVCPRKPPTSMLQEEGREKPDSMMYPLTSASTSMQGSQETSYLLELQEDMPSASDCSRKSGWFGTYMGHKYSNHYFKPGPDDNATGIMTFYQFALKLNIDIHDKLTPKEDIEYWKEVYKHYVAWNSPMTGRGLLPFDPRADPHERDSNAPLYERKSGMPKFMYNIFCRWRKRRAKRQKLRRLAGVPSKKYAREWRHAHAKGLVPEIRPIQEIPCVERPGSWLGKCGFPSCYPVGSEPTFPAPLDRPL